MSILAMEGWWYRSVSAAGAATVTALAVIFANLPSVQVVTTTYVPLLWRLSPTVLTGTELQLAVGTSVLLVSGLLIPLFKPRPRRILDVAMYTQKRILIAGLAIATLGYFNYSFRLPRATLGVTMGVLCILMPLWFIGIRIQTQNDTARAIVVGDDTEQIDQILTEATIPIVGYLCPPTAAKSLTAARTQAGQTAAVATDGGATNTTVPRLGGLSQLESTLIQHDISTVCLAFQAADRGEFFGTLDLCHKHGVDVKVHRDYADDVLTSSGDVATLASVDIEPWDPQDYVIKRLFDIAFATTGLLVLSPLVVVLAVAIKLDSPGAILYAQTRTAGFGDTFPVYKFRTMVPEGASALPVEDDANDRITRVGRLLRATHMDEIPQLWSILIGNMSVVGPRAAWTEEEKLLEQETDTWRKRWFVKPGLTGLAQINDAKSTDPEAKLRYDLRYIRQQSFWFDIQIVIRQLWKVTRDAVRIVIPGHSHQDR